MYILGISAFYHDSAAALVTDGHIVAAAQEERFSRRKHDARFPVNALRYCLDFDAVTAVIPCTPARANALRSAWIPAPPPESDPAIESTRGMGRSCVIDDHGRGYSGRV